MSVLTACSACICSIMRMVASIEVHGAKDITWVITPEGLWAYVTTPNSFTLSCSANRTSSHGELSCGIICGCMPVLPQFFRHFVPKITSYLSSGKSSTDKASAGSSNRGGERMRKKSVVPHLDTQVYMELDDHTQLKPTEDNGVGPKVWADEVLAEDEEKALPPFAEDAITAISQRHQYYNGR